MPRVKEVFSSNAKQPALHYGLEDDLEIIEWDPSACQPLACSEELHFTPSPDTASTRISMATPGSGVSVVSTPTSLTLPSPPGTGVSGTASCVLRLEEHLPLTRQEKRREKKKRRKALRATERAGKELEPAPLQAEKEKELLESKDEEDEFREDLAAEGEEEGEEVWDGCAREEEEEEVWNDMALARDQFDAFMGARTGLVLSEETLREVYHETEAKYIAWTRRLDKGFMQEGYEMMDFLEGLDDGADLWCEPCAASCSLCRIRDGETK